MGSQELVLMKVHSIRDHDRSGYVEHVFCDDIMVACIYDVNNRYKFSCKYKLLPSQDYNTVADAKHDLFMILEYVLKIPVNVN
jgi:hypothetical protein